MKLEELANQNYEKLSAVDRQLLHYLLANRERCAGAGSKQIADAANISRATLLRFCHKLGLDSFADLKYFLKSASQPQAPQKVHATAQALLDVQYEQYHRLIDEIHNRDYREICGMISRADNIYIYGTGNAQKAEAEEFKRIFLSVGKCVIDLFDLGEVCFAKRGFTKNDLFVIISLSGETPAGIEILKELESSAAEKLSITRWDNNTIARMCRSNLYVGTKTMQGYQNLSYEMIGAFYVLLDVLYVQYLELTRGKNSEN